MLIAFGAPLVGGSPAAAAPLDCAARNPLPADLANELAARYPGRRFTVQVYAQPGCVYDFNRGESITTASVVKLEIMAGVLLRAQDEGRGLTQWERDRIWPMITQSANQPATELWQSLGGEPGMEAVDDRFGLTATDQVGPTWGLTSTTAADQVTLVRQVVAGEFGPLTAPYRAEARYYLSNVIPEQRWGASAGVPAGWSVMQKNGFAGSQCCGWRINTVGWVERPDGTGWALALLSDGWATQDEGVAAVDELSGRINSALAASAVFGPSAVFTGTWREDVVDHAAWGALSQRSWTSWGGSTRWFDLGGAITSAPDAAIPSSNAAPEFFARGTDNAVWHYTWTGSSWRQASLGGQCASGPTAFYSSTNRLDVACRGPDNRVWMKSIAPGVWPGWFALSGSVTSDPDLGGKGGGVPPELVVRATDDSVWRYTFNGSTWTPNGLGGRCRSGPTEVYSGTDRLDVFCRGTDDQLWGRTWRANAGWGNWFPVGGRIVSDPDAASQGAGFAPRIVARGTDFAVWEYVWDGHAWRVQSWGVPGR